MLLLVCLMRIVDCYKCLFVLQTDNSNVNSTTTKVTNRSNNTTNLNSSLTYLNLNNTVSNTNANISSRLLTVDNYFINYVINNFDNFVTFNSTVPLGKK